MKFFHITLLCIFFVIFTTNVDTMACDHHTIHVAVNLTSFPCPVSAINCKSMILSELNDSSKTISQCSNKFVFQSGNHVVKRGLSLSLTAKTEVIIWGEEDVTITCESESMIDIRSAPTITINNVHFQYCENVSVTSLKHTPAKIEIANSYFTASYLKLSGGNSETLVITVKNINFNGSSMTLMNANRVDISGQGSSITCVNTDFVLNVKPKGTIQLSDVKLYDCSNIKIHSKSMIVAIETYNSWFNNSCLKFEASRTNGDFHRVLITMNKTKFEQCSCKSIQLFTKPGISVHITLDQVIVTDNQLRFIESENNQPVSITVMGHCIFHQNKNFLLYLDSDSIHFNRANVSFVNGTVDTTSVLGAPIYAKNSTVTFEESSVLFSQNQGPLCGGIVAESTLINFKDNVTIIFHSNSGLKGGALSLYTESRLQFNASQSNITLGFQNSTAQMGGAIYVEDSVYKDIESVFKLQCEPENMRLVFGDNNVASFSGDQIYGGWIDWFVNKTASNVPENRTDMVNTFIEFENENYTQVTSHPIRICLCDNGNINCSITNHNMTIYGRALSLDLVGVGQRYTPVITHVEASLLCESKSIVHQSNNMDSRLASLQSTCTKISYKVKSQSDEEMITLKPFLPHLYYNSHSRDLLTDGIVDNLFTQLTIKLKIHQCPWGLLELANGSCKCQLSIYNCDMDNYAIHRSKQQWIGAAFEHNHGKEDTGVITHQHCPFDYCRSDNKSFSIRLDNRDKQC